MRCVCCRVLSIGAKALLVAAAGAISKANLIASERLDVQGDYGHDAMREPNIITEPAVNEENCRKCERDRKRRRRLVSVSRRVAMKNEGENEMRGYTTQ